jgi:CHASE2 domain-containing sensor protein
MSGKKSFLPLIHAGNGLIYIKQAKLASIFILLLTIVSACSKEAPHIITIVDIGNNPRPEIGRQIEKIRQFNPRIIGMDFHLVPDSTWKDSTIVNALNKSVNTVQVVTLHNYFEVFDAWDSLEYSHPKFKVSDRGFANLVSQDSVFVPELPLKQMFRTEPVYAFSYVVAKNSYGVKPRFSDSLDYFLRFKTDSLGLNYNLISAEDFSKGNYSAEYFKDKIVLLGYMGESEDYHYADPDKKRKVKGVEIHAALIGQMINRK